MERAGLLHRYRRASDQLFRVCLAIRLARLLSLRDDVTVKTPKSLLMTFKKLINHPFQRGGAEKEPLEPVPTMEGETTTTLEGGGDGTSQKGNGRARPVHERRPKTLIDLSLSYPVLS